MVVGVLALKLQGSFNEHLAGTPSIISAEQDCSMILGIGDYDFDDKDIVCVMGSAEKAGSEGIEIRKAEQLQNASSLIIPGGESTTMVKLAEYHNLFPALREFVQMGKPVWGTCADLIFLADKATGGPPSFQGVFIRAPAILDVGPAVQVLADIPVSSDKASSSDSGSQIKEENTDSDKRVIVAVRQGNLLATAFHPELTADSRWHTYLLKMANEIGEEGALSCVSTSVEGPSLYSQAKNDLPIFQ